MVDIIATVESLDGCTVRVTFDFPIADNAAFNSPSSYTLLAVLGAPAQVQAATKRLPSGLGYLSVDLVTSGTTLGGSYTLTVSGLETVGGIPISPPENTGSFLALGQTLGITATADDSIITLVFKDELARDVTLLDNAARISPASYALTTGYPIAPVINAVDVSGTHVALEVGQLTSTSYDAVIGPAQAYAYSGAILPNQDLNLDAHEIGSGSSTVSNARLGLSKPEALVSYGWSLLDLSGNLTPDASFLAVFMLNGANASASTIASVVVSDGSVQISLTFTEVSGDRVVVLEAGGYASQISFDWRASTFEASLLRNQEAGFYAVLIDGFPVETFAIVLATTPATTPASTTVMLDAGVASTGFEILSVNLSASETLYTESLNLVFNLACPFVVVTPPTLVNDRVRTRRGPLVKAWGDWTPAGPADVAIRVNGVPVPVGAVNPYTGEIFPVTPIPLTPVGVATIAVDYCWIVNPIFALSGLNTTGLTLNTWGRPNGRTAQSPPSSNLGVASRTRLPMSVILGPLVKTNRPKPKQIGHTYIGYQREYSALTNDPTTLLLNKNPHAIADGALTAASVKQTGRFTGVTDPTAQGWLLSGTDTGQAQGDGSYLLVDPHAGDYPTNTAALYSRSLDLALPSITQGSARFRAVEISTYDGVFSGLAFGAHDGRNLLVIGALRISGIEHFGVLQDANRPDLEASWDVGLKVAAVAATQTTITIPMSVYPHGVGYGSKFRVALGPQSGVYQITSCGIVSMGDQGTVEITFIPALPEPVANFGSRDFDALFETRWSGSDLSSLRFIARFNPSAPDNPNGLVTAYLSGRVSGVLGTFTTPAYPAETGLLLQASITGASFWGSISRRAANKSLWDLVQYAATPVALTQTVSGVYVENDMAVLPENSSSPWFITGGYGDSSLVADALFLESSAQTSAGAGSTSEGFEFGYSRTDPYLTPKVTTNLFATVRVDQGMSAILRIRDTSREVRVTTLLYRETDVTRGLVTDLPSNYFSGLQAPENEGWSSSTIAPVAWGQSLGINKTTVLPAVWQRTSNSPVSCTYEGAVLTARFKAASLVGVVTPYFAGHIKTGPATARYVRVAFIAGNTLNLTDESGAVIMTIPAINWIDGGVHEYRLVCDPLADLVTVFIDNALAGQTDLSDFSATTPEFTARFGFTGSGLIETEWFAFTMTPLRPLALAGQSLNRAFGIWLGGAAADINQYAIPRSDSSSDTPNSDLAALPVPMDWTTNCEIRVYLDPAWGVSFYRPDLPLPPGAVSSAYITETTNPTDAWVNVEYRRLPRCVQDRGEVSFGSLDSRFISRSRWSDLSYRVRARPYGYGIAQTGMVLNRAIPFRSGDWNLDATPEVHLIPARGFNTVFVSDSAIYGDRIFRVRFAGVTLPAATWVFNPTTQEIVLLGAGIAVPAGALVEVTFAPAKPTTAAYQSSRPLVETVTVLNSGTPTVPQSRDGAITRLVVDTPDGGSEVQFSYNDSSRYASVQFYQTEQGDDLPLSTLCDGPGPGMGLSEIGISGRLTTDPFTVSGGRGGPFNRANGSPVFKGSATHFGGLVLIASGGVKQVALRGVLNTAIAYPNARGPLGLPPESRFGLNRDFAISLSDTQTESWDLSGSLLANQRDNIPPSAISGPVNPDGTPGAFGLGACIAEITYFDASEGPSRLGPWGGLVSLTPKSLLGGGAALPNSAFILAGGVHLTPPVVTTRVLESATI